MAARFFPRPARCRDSGGRGAVSGSDRPKTPDMKSAPSRTRRSPGARHLGIKQLDRARIFGLAVSLFEDFQKIMPGAGVEGLETPIVENEKVGAAERPQEARMTAIAARRGEIFEELWDAMIEDGAIVAAGFMADGASQPAFADAGWADQGEIVVGVDPVSLGEPLEQGAIETSGGAVVDVLDACLMAELCSAQPRRQALVSSP
jgi:hypothetical protein